MLEPVYPRLCTLQSLRTRASGIVVEIIEISLKFDAPLDAKHVSSEQTLAKLDEFRQMPWIEPNYEETTLEGLKVVERYWHRYSPLLSDAVR
jgi:hypothetical protein